MTGLNGTILSWLPVALRDAANPLLAVTWPAGIWPADQHGGLLRRHPAPAEDPAGCRTEIDWHPGSPGWTLLC
ncbi:MULTISPECIES: hypothetical protein [unclassified Frankia]|uniref:hypothetical protein n=1 Tax=unclassified Frankia TaxID=2632575 RepID=UPI001EF62CE3|nr:MULTISPECIES: hypothetical protein [unclassified Frankia]